MSTSMHRLQISLPAWQMEFLSGRARRDRVSVAKVIRLLVEREAELSNGSPDSILAIAGIAGDEGAILRGIAVSERPDLYLAELSAPRPKSRPPKRKRPR